MSDAAKPIDLSVITDPAKRTPDALSALQLVGTFSHTNLAAALTEANISEATYTEFLNAFPTDLAAMAIKVIVPVGLVQQPAALKAVGKYYDANKSELSSLAAAHALKAKALYAYRFASEAELEIPAEFRGTPDALSQRLQTTVGYYVEMIDAANQPDQADTTTRHCQTHLAHFLTNLKIDPRIEPADAFNALNPILVFDATALGTAAATAATQRIARIALLAGNSAFKQFALYVASNSDAIVDEARGAFLAAVIADESDTTRLRLRDLLGKHPALEAKTKLLTRAILSTPRVAKVVAPAAPAPAAEGDAPPSVDTPAN